MLGVLGLQLISVAAAVATQQGPVAATPAAALVAPVAATAEWLCRTSEHGAQPGEERPATAALQAVIDTCTSRQVGQPCGRVVVDTPGTYLSGALLAADGCVHLELPAGATLLASARRQDYPGGQPDWYLLRFRNCTGCSLSGGGTLDGGGRRWVLPQARRQQQRKERVPAPGGWAQGRRQDADAPRKAVRNWRDPSCRRAEECRPRLLGVVDSHNVSIAGAAAAPLRLRDPIYWALHVLRSERVHVSAVSIRGDWAIPNTDGIDIDSSRHVAVADCEVDTADDAVCLKTTAPGRPLEHVTVRDCRLRSRSSAVKLGSESVAPMRAIEFSRLAIADAHRGLAIQLRDGGDVSDVSFRSIGLSTRLYEGSWWGAGEPIHVTAVPRVAGGRVGAISNVTFADIQALAEAGVFLAGGPMGGGSHGTGSHGSGSSGGSSSSGGSGAAPGQRQYSLRGIRLERVRVDLVARSAWPGGCQDYRPSSNASSSSGSSGGQWWPSGVDCSAGGTAPLWVAGAQQVLLQDVAIRRRQPYRDDWQLGAWVDPSSTRDVRLRRVNITRAAAASRGGDASGTGAAAAVWR